MTRQKQTFLALCSWMMLSKYTGWIARVATDLPIPVMAALGPRGKSRKAFRSSPPLFGLAITHGLPPLPTVSSNGV